MEILYARHRDDLVRALGLMLVGATFSACGAPVSEVKTTRTVSAAPKPSVELLKRLLEMHLDIGQRLSERRVRGLAGAVDIEFHAHPVQDESVALARWRIDPASGSMDLLMKHEDGRSRAILRITESGLGELLAAKANLDELVSRREAQITGDRALLEDAIAALSAAPEDEVLEGLEAARLGLFESWGASIPGGRESRLFPLVSGASRGLPPWPRREQYIVARVGTNTIIGTDGLTDTPPHGGGDGPNGFGIEVWAETDAQLANPAQSWLAALVSAVGYHVADGAFEAAYFLGDPGVLLFEVHISELSFDGRWPASVVTPRGTIGVLLGMRSPERPDRLASPFADVRYVNIRVISSKQLDALATRGPSALEEVVGTSSVSRLE